METLLDRPRGEASRRALTWAAVAVAGAAATLPLWLVPDLWGTDRFANEIRLVAYSRCLAEGIAWPGWLPDLAHGHGLPLFHYYPALLYALAAPLHAAGLDPRSALVAVLAIAMGGGTVAAGHAVARRAGAAAGVAAAVLWLATPYLHVDLQVRLAWAELLALSLAPVALGGVADLAEGLGGRGAWLRAAGGLAGVVLAHNGTALVVAGISVVLAVALVAGRPGARARAFAVAGAMASAIGATAFFWLPALADLGLVPVERMFEGPWSPAEHAVFPWQLIGVGFGRGPSVPGPNDAMSMSAGVVHGVAFLGLLAAAVARRATTGRLAKALAALAFVLVAAMLPPVAAVLEGFAPYRSLQFPFRLLGPLALALAWAVPLLAARVLPPRIAPASSLVLAAAAVMAILPAFQGFRVMTPGEAAVFDPVRERGADGLKDLPDPYATTTWAHEYVPRTVVAWPDGPSAAPVEAPPWIRLDRVETSCDGVSVEGVAERPGVLRYSTFDFEGFRVEVSGREVVHGHDPETGFVIAGIDAAGPFEAVLRFDPTPATHAGRVVSLMTLLAVAVSGILGKRRQHPLTPGRAEIG
jgi:hypothetical protein